VLGPQSTAFFLLMVVAFAGLMWWLAVARQLVFRVFAACLAFVAATLFGVAAVNKYYDYYQNWNAALADLTNQGGQVPQASGAADGSGTGFSTFLGRNIDYGVAARQGFTARLTVPGAASHITRTVFVYLPPQYFWAGNRHRDFPAIELIHGFPGVPQDWISVVGITSTLLKLIRAGLAKPAVLVMPDANGGRGISLQCLNQVRGPQDATYLARDLPTAISRIMRVQPPGPAWGIAGYSEGGFCAANLGLRYGQFYGFAGVLSGYFRPLGNQLGRPPRPVSPFGGNARLRHQNTPDDLVNSLPAGQPVPQFWLGAGAGSRLDVRNARIFDQLLQIRQPGVTLRLVPGGGHSMFTWRSLVPPMLEWMTPRIASEANRASARAASARTALARAARETGGRTGGNRAGRARKAAAHGPARRHRR
jgi:enterochelin esterase-like enzyme